MKKWILGLLAGVCALAGCTLMQQVTPSVPGVSAGGKHVMLDIGHSLSSPGATSPDKRVRECTFWYSHVGIMQDELRRAGANVTIVNRDKAPASGTYAALASSLPVVHLNRTDDGVRYPSKHHPEFIGAGMVSADYGIEKKPACMVFLHLNCVGASWRSGNSQSVVLYNKNCGKGLADSICSALNKEVFNVPGGLDNGGGACHAMPRTQRELGGAGWLNTLDAEGVPAAIIEVIYTDNQKHVDFISNEANATKFSRAIAHGISAWLAR